MSIRRLTTTEDFARYDAWVRSHPNGTLWQSLEWKQYQEALGREVHIYVHDDGRISASALVVIDRTMGGFSTWEIPRGPLGRIDNGQLTIENLLPRIVEDAKADKCFSIFASPSSSPFIVNCPLSIINSSRFVHCGATRIIDLRASEDQILAQMKPKGRYNIALAQKHGVVVSKSKDFNVFSALAQQTSKRDRFQSPGSRTYRAFLEHLPGAFLLLAYTDAQEPITGLLGVEWNGIGIYYYGASSHAHRALMAPYILQWEAIRHCKTQGCHSYDLLGIAPPEAVDHHPWAGITAFKEKFGGTVMSYPPEQEIVLMPLVRRLLQAKRRILG